MKQTLEKLLKFINFLWKVLPILIEAINDLTDDGVINGSSRTTNKSGENNDKAK